MPQIITSLNYMHASIKKYCNLHSFSNVAIVLNSTSRSLLSDKEVNHFHLVSSGSIVQRCLLLFV